MRKLEIHKCFSNSKAMKRDRAKRDNLGMISQYTKPIIPPKWPINRILAESFKQNTDFYTKMHPSQSLRVLIQWVDAGPGKRLFSKASQGLWFTAKVEHYCSKQAISTQWVCVHVRKEKIYFLSPLLWNLIAFILKLSFTVMMRIFSFSSYFMDTVYWVVLLCQFHGRIWL